MCNIDWLASSLIRQAYTLAAPSFAPWVLLPILSQLDGVRRRIWRLLFVLANRTDLLANSSLSNFLRVAGGVRGWRECKLYPNSGCWNVVASLQRWHNETENNDYSWWEWEPKTIVSIETRQFLGKFVN